MKKVFALFFLMAFALPQPARAATWPLGADVIGGKAGRTSKPLAKTSQTSVNQTLVNIGQVASWIYSDGRSAIQPDGNSGFYFPRGNLIATAVFQDGLVWGGKVNDGGNQTVRVGGQTFSIGTLPGAIVSRGVAEDVNDRLRVDRVWRIRRDYATADLQLDAAENNLTTTSAVTQAQIDAVRAQYAEAWRDWPAYKGAPFYDADGDGQYTPQFKADGSPKVAPGPEEDFDPEKHADEPGIAGADQVVWLVANDLDESTVQGMYGSNAIGLEMQLTMWAYRRSDPLGNIIFKQFRVIYKGTATTPAIATIDSMYFCQFSDIDLGSAGDDLAGSDTTLSLGYVYNAVSTDGNYAQISLPPPASGYDFFAGPIVPDANGEAIFGLKKRPGFRNLPMTTFAFFVGGGTDQDPTRGGPYNGTLQWWNLLRGYKPRPENPPAPWTDPTNNNAVTKFRVPGDPVTGEGWLDDVPGDHRIVMASGPVTLAVGDTQEVVVAAMAGLGSDRLSSVSVLKFTDRFAQEAFDNLFELPKPPATPVVSASEFDGQILLNWGENPEAVATTEEVVNKGYVFQGYNVYQVPSAGASLNQGVRLATFDVVDEVTTISQEIFDEGSGLVLSLPVQFGKNTGVQRTFSVTQDRLRDKPLVNGQTYYFAVAAYNYNGEPGLTTKTLESAPTILTVVPQTTKPGVRYTAQPGEVAATTHTGPSDGEVRPLVVDPSKLTGDQYKVTFSLDAEGHTLWALTNVTTGAVLLANQANQSGDANYLITDGVQVVVEGPPPGIKHDDVFSRPDDPQSWGWDIPSGTRRFTWANADGNHFEGFNGAIGWASPNSVFGGGPPGVPATEIKKVRLVLASATVEGVFDANDPNVSFAYRYGRNFALPPARPEFAPFIINAVAGYSFQDYVKSMPLAAFDMTNPDAPRRLALGFLENNVANGLVNGRYFPGDNNVYNNTDAAGPREWLFIFDADYTEATPNPAFQVEATTSPLPIMYFSTMNRRGSVPFSPGGTGEDQLDLFPNIPNSPLDEFVFATTAPTSDEATAKSDLSLVNVFPNPYLGFNSAELNRFYRYVTFSHLPRRATIRIFNLAGVLVRTIMKDDDGQFINWDLLNERGLPAASGVYVAHLQFPDLNEVKILKLALVREDQVLPNF